MKVGSRVLLTDKNEDSIPGVVIEMIARIETDTGEVFEVDIDEVNTEWETDLD